MKGRSSPLMRRAAGTSLWEGGRQDDGSSLIEVAAVMPFLLLMLVGAVDFGQAYYVGIEVSSAAQAGTSYGLSKPTDTAGMQMAANLDASDVPTMTATATWGCECSDGTGASVSCSSVPSCGVNLVNYVDVATAVNFVPLLMYPGVPSSFPLTGHSRMRVSPMSWIRRVAEEESGSELLEFALSATVLLIVIFGIMDCSRALYTYHYLAQASRQATRYASLRGATWTSLLCPISPYQCMATASDVSNYVKSLTPLGLMSSGLTVTTTWPGTTATGAVCNALSINNSPGCMVNVKVSYTFTFILPFLPKSSLPMSSTSKLIIAQ